MKSKRKAEQLGMMTIWEGGELNEDLRSSRESPGAEKNDLQT